MEKIGVICNGSADKGYTLGGRALVGGERLTVNLPGGETMTVMTVINKEQDVPRLFLVPIGAMIRAPRGAKYSFTPIPE